MARGATAIVGCLLILSLAGPAAGRIADFRYYPPTDEFSISMAKDHDRGFKVDREQVLSDRLMIDFRYNPGSTFFGMSSMRNIEWVRLDQPISRWQMPNVGPALATDYISAEFGPDAFRIQDSKFLPNSAPPSFEFRATGFFESVPATIDGVVFDFDDRLALVCEFRSPSTSDMWHTMDFEGQFADWAHTLRREK